MNIGEISYRKEDSSLVIYNFNSSNILNDSIFNGVYRNVLIEKCDSETTMKILNHLNDSLLLSIRIHDYPSIYFGFDFNKFTKLNTLEFEGNSTKKTEIYFGDHLEWIAIITDDSCFPSFGSSPFNNIEFMLVFGNYNTVPKWIENMSKLERTIFRSGKLQDIKCNLCKLKNLYSFDISDTPLYEREFKYFESHGKFLELEKYRECSNRLKFGRLIMPG